MVFCKSDKSHEESRCCPCASPVLCVFSSLLDACSRDPHGNPTKRGWCYFPFPSEDTEAPRDEITCLVSLGR